jgi:hypothetical protein
MGDLTTVRRRIEEEREEARSAATGVADPADVALCRQAWQSKAGTISHEAEQMFRRNEHFFALILLLEHLFDRRFNRWRITFADDGSFYRSTVWIADANGSVRVYEGSHPSSMLRSMLAIVDQATGPRV